MHRLLILTASALLLAGCSDDDVAPPDAAPADHGAPDAAPDAADAAVDTLVGKDRGIKDLPAAEAGVYLCFSPLACSAVTGTYCKHLVGCSGIGKCTEKATSCPTTSDPVCGCDDQSYLNACLAAKAGVSVKGAGACTAMVTCPGGTPCESDEYCQTPIGVCAGPGLCAPRPKVKLECGAVNYPVCGCDGNTYANPCFAGAAGTSVSYEKACVPNGCSSNGECTFQQYCKKTDGDCLGVGSCHPLPSPTYVCIPLGSNPQVCGCDGKTYTNSCAAEKAGVNVAKTGPC